MPVEESTAPPDANLNDLNYTPDPNLNDLLFHIYSYLLENKWPFHRDDNSEINTKG